MQLNNYPMHALRRLLHHALLLLSALAFLSAPLAAQNEQVTTRARAERLFNEGEQLRKVGSKESLQQAIQKFVEARPLFHALNDNLHEASILATIGFIYDSLNEKRKALDYYSQALPIDRAAGDRAGEVVTLINIGAVYHDLGDNQKALDYYNQALPLSRDGRDRSMEAETLNRIGRVYDTLGEKQKALDYFNQALPIFRAVGIREGEAGVLSNIADVYDTLNEGKKALDYYEQALSLSRATENHMQEAAILHNIGRVYSSFGEMQKGLEYINQSLVLIRALGDNRSEARALSSIGVLYSNLGEKQKALDYLWQALPLSRATGDRQGEAIILGDIGVVYDSLGEKQKAVDYYVQALPIYRAVGDREGEARTLRYTGLAYNLSGEERKALAYYEQALLLSRAIGDRGGEAVTLSNIGVIYAEIGETQKALTHHEQALTLQRTIGYRADEATTLNNIGFIYEELGQQPQALDHYEQALSLIRTIGDRRGEATTLSNIAYLERDRGNLNQARIRIEAALDAIESLRTKIGSQELRSSFFATVQGYYDLYIDLLMLLHKQQPDAGYDGRALQVSERARARSLLELLTEAGADIRQGVDPQLVERERALQQQLNASALRKIQLLSGLHSEEQAAAIAKEIESLTSEFQQVETQIRQTSPRYAALTQPQPLSLKEIQSSVLDADSVLLEYSLSNVKSYLWAVTPDSITSYELPKGEEIKAEAKHFYDLLNSRNKEVEGETGAQRAARVARDDAEAKLSGMKLSRMILGPAAERLKGKHLVVVADGVLQYIPFAALPEPSGTADAAPLIAKHEIVNVPSASTLAVLRREAGARTSPTKTLAVLADPVFSKDDVRFKAPGSKPKAGGRSLSLSEGDGRGIALVAAAKHAGVSNTNLDIPRLLGTRQEADEIVKLVPPTQYKEALDFEASRATATSADLGQYRYVHFATHGFLDSQQPELTGIVLSMFDEHGEPQDGFLRAHEVFNLKFSADVVVLSACQTGLGKDVKGEGLVGLTRGFMYAGSPRVVVSLWSVSDAATAELMTRFYRGMLKDKLRPAAALRAAQISLMKERGLESPFYWAAFTLQGERR